MKRPDDLPRHSFYTARTLMKFVVVDEEHMGRPDCTMIYPCVVSRGADTEMGPRKTRRWLNVGLMLGQRRRRWANNNLTLSQRLVIAGP